MNEPEPVTARRDAPIPARTGNFRLLAGYYAGHAALQYEGRRRSLPGWKAEEDALTSFLLQMALPSGSAVLDVPVGTGRFLGLYALARCRVTGIDISADMLRAARRSADAAGLPGIELCRGDAARLERADRSADMAVCVRFLCHLEHEGLESVLTELVRVSRRYIVAHLRIALPESDGRRDPAMIRRAREALRRWTAPLPALRPRKVHDRAMTMHREARFHDLLRCKGLRILDLRTVHCRPDRGYEARMYLLEKLRPDSEALR